MIDEALITLVKLSQAAVEPKGIDVKDSRRKVMITTGGDIKEITIPPADRSHYVASLADLVAFAKDHAPKDSVGTVWHNADGVILLVDDSDRRDFVAFKLALSKPWRTLQHLDDDEPALDQRRLIRVLRHDLGLGEHVVGPFRRLDWTTQANGVGEVQRTRDRMGRDVNAEVSGTAELPDEIQVHVPVYDVKGERDTEQVMLSLDIDVPAQRFLLVPRPGELALAVDRRQDDIHERLESELEIPVYYGKP